MTWIQYISCVTNTITTCFQCALARMKYIRTGYTKFFWNMFKTFILVAYTTHMRRTLFEWIGMDWNNQEWPPPTLNKLEWSILILSCYVRRTTPTFLLSYVFILWQIVPQSVWEWEIIPAKLPYKIDITQHHCYESLSYMGRTKRWESSFLNIHTLYHISHN